MEKTLFTKDFEQAARDVFAWQKFRIIYHDLGFHELFLESSIWFDEIIQLREYIEPQYLTISVLDGYSICLSFTFKDNVKACV